MTILDWVDDPDGRRVKLTVERWTHIVDRGFGHPELRDHQGDVARAVATPDEVRPGRRPNEPWYLLRDAGPSRWLQVVVAYEEDRGWVLTAFGRRRNP